MSIKPENRIWVAVYGSTAFIMLVAMGVFGWLAWTSRNEPGIGRVAGGRSLGTATSAISDEQYQELARFEAPAYRAQRNVPKSMRSGMARYATKDYTGAASALREAARANPDVNATRFYLGISLLLGGDRIAGIQELQDLAEGPASAYQERARFYLAKALIGEHDLPRAQKQLAELIAQHGDLQKQAAELLAQIRPAG